MTSSKERMTPVKERVEARSKLWTAIVAMMKYRLLRYSRKTRIQ